MSLDLYLYDRETDEEVAWVNWLRNPFGLCNWAMDNVDHDLGASITLHRVCNMWSYDKGDDINRELFKTVVDDYGRCVMELKCGYFCFDDWGKALANFTSGNWSAPTCPDRWWPFDYLNDHKDVINLNGKLAIPQEWFSNPMQSDPFYPAWDASLVAYQAWYRQLMDFANLLQDDRYRFYCSN